MKEVTKEFIMQKMVEKWIKDNPGLMEDMKNLAVELTMFNTKWGSKLEPNDFLPPTS